MRSQAGELRRSRRIHRIDTEADPADRAAPGKQVRLGERLVAEGIVTAAELDAGLQRQLKSGRLIGAELVAGGALTDDEFANALSAHLTVPLADLSRQVPAPDAVALLPEETARSMAAIPLSTARDAVLVAVADPRPDVQDAVRAALGQPVSWYVAPAGDVQRAIDSSYRAMASIAKYVAAFEAHQSSNGNDDRAAAEESPVVRTVDLIITQALRDRASDVHIEPQEDGVWVRFRIDGALHDVVQLPERMGPAVVSRIKILAEMNIVERRRPQDGQIVTHIDGRELDIRVSTLATIWGEKCVLRLLDRGRSLLHLAELGMPADIRDTVSRLIRAPFGMVLCAGPTGSGKTTTLYAGLTEVNDPRRNITTVEDPVEYVVPRINQIQTNDQAGVTFAHGLKSILRQDPDVILVGEIRDVETARIAVQSALTGHLVLSSLHATDAVAAIHRFLDMGIESFLIASSVVGVIGQRLVRRICPTCTEPYTPSDEELSFYTEAGGADKKVFVRGAGCNFCAQTGFLGRIGVFEVLQVTPEVRRLIVGWATHEELRRVAVAQGMRTLQQEATTLVENDITTIDEVVRSIYAL